MQLQIDLEATPNNVMSTSQTVAHAWMSYAKTNALKPKTRAYMYAQHAFLSGVAGLLQEDMPTILFYPYA
jgi:hypothetical protein